MKKSILTICALCVLIGVSYADDNTQDKVYLEKLPPQNQQMVRMRQAQEKAFEQKLGLTEVQKLKVREHRKQSFEKMKPVMDKIKNKHKEAEVLQRSNLSIKEKEERLAIIDKEIKELEKEANSIRKQNMKDFESILTLKQKKILKEMKKNGRKDFEQRRHHNPPPFKVN